MIIHIGWNTSLDTEDIIAVLTKSSAASGHNATAALVAAAKQAGTFVPCAPEAGRKAERTYILCEETNGTRLYASAIHASTLLRRIAADGLYDIG